MADTFELNPDIVQSATGTIDGDIEQIETALYGREVRASIAEALYLLEHSSAGEDEIEAIKERLTTAEDKIDKDSQQISDIWTAIENLDPSSATGILSQGSVNGDEGNTYTLYSSGRCDIELKGSDFETASTIDWGSTLFSGVTVVYIKTNGGGGRTIPYMLQHCTARTIAISYWTDSGRYFGGRLTIDKQTFGTSSIDDENLYTDSIEIGGYTASLTIESDAFTPLRYLKEIIYIGSMDEWDSAEKEDGWEGLMGYFINDVGSKQYIRCLDGNFVRTGTGRADGSTVYWSDWTREGSSGSVDSIPNSEIDGIYSEV